MEHVRKSASRNVWWAWVWICTVALGCGSSSPGTDVATATTGLTSSSAWTSSTGAGTDPSTGGSAGTAGTRGATTVGGTDSGPATTSGGGGPKFDVGEDPGTTTATAGGAGTDGCEPPPPGNATLTGTVFAPNLEIPISGALVYLSDTPPVPVPDGVYCAECVQVPCDKHFVLTNPDGSFSLPATAGPQTLVVTKGQFLHAVQINVTAGANPIAPTDSNLPGEWNPAEGKWIPRILVIREGFDKIYNVLAKLGLGEVDASGNLQMGTERFDLVEGAQALTTFSNLTEMQKYHIIFVPCTGPGLSGIQNDPARQENIRQWTAAGGKWYVTDWSNEYLYVPFPRYQTFHRPASPDLSEYDTTATVLDPDLLAWLEALPAPLKDIGGGLPNLLMLPQVEVVDNWSGLDATPPVIVQDQDGNNVDVGHYPWVEGPCLTCSDTVTIRPMTVTAGYGCGKLLFSTYHTDESAHAGLTPQELILLYIILEIGVCHDTLPPPPPPP